MKYYKKKSQSKNNIINIYGSYMGRNYQENVNFNHNIGTHNTNRQQIKTEMYQVNKRKLNGDENQQGENQKEEKNEDEKEIPQKENQDKTNAKDKKEVYSIEQIDDLI